MEEDGKEDFARFPRTCPKRRSPRTCVKKLDPSAYKESLEFTPIPKRSVKRKSRSSDDDPIFSEVDDVDELSDSTKKVPGYRCSPHLIPELMDSLSEKQRGWVKKIEWASIQHMIESRVPKSLTMWLVDRVDTTTGTLDVGGIPVDIREAVVRILKLPCGNLKVPPPLNGRCKAKRPKSDTTSLDKKYSVNGRGTCAKDEIKLLLAEQEDEDAFCRSFVMLILCIYAAPTTSLHINRNYLPSLLDVSKIRLMDWCGFIAEYLIQGIREFRESRASHVQVPGCVHILPLMYVDCLVKFGALKFPEPIELMEGEPRIHFIGSQHVQLVASLDVKSRTKDHIEYAALMEFRKSNSDNGKESYVPAPCNDSEKISPPQGPVSTEFQDGSCTKDASGEEKLEFIRLEMKHSREQLLEEFKTRIELSDLKILEKCQQILFTKSGRSTEPAHRQDHPKNPSSSNPLEPGINNSENLPSTHSGQLASDRSVPSSEVPNLSVQPEGIAEEGQSIDVQFKKTNITSSAGQGAIFNADDSFLTDPNVDPMARPDERAVCVSAHTASKESNGIDSGTPIYDDDSVMDKRNLDTRTVNKTSKFTQYTESVNDVVNIAASAAVEAAGIHEAEASTEDIHPHLSMLSEAAFLQGSPTYDMSPAGCRNDSAGSFIGFGLESSKHALAVTSLFAKPPRDLCVEMFDPTIDVAASFDKSPSIAPVSSLSHSQKVQHVLPDTCAPDVVREAPKFAVNPVRQPISNRICASQNSLVIYSPGTSALHLEQELPKVGSSGSDSSKVAPSSKSGSTDSEENTTSDEASLEKRAEPCFSDDVPLVSSQGYNSSQNYTWNSKEVIDIPDDPPNVPPSDIIHIPPLQKELEAGARFKFGGSVPVQTIKMYEKYKQLGKDYGTYNFVLTTDAKETYQTHVVNSSGRGSSRSRNVSIPTRNRTKIQIKGFHITKGEFLDCLKPKGEVCQTLMGLCSVAIMCDWESKKKIILNQSIIVELLKDGPLCDHENIAARLKKLALDDIEEIFLPILSGNHWFVAVVNVLKEIVEFYDSLLVVKEGSHPHKNIWENLASNLERAYCLARKRSIHIFFFKPIYAAINLQTNIHDCGFHVIQVMECHKMKDIVGYSKKKTMMSYRRYLSHTLIYHRFNDLNPKRPYLHQVSP